MYDYLATSFRYEYIPWVPTLFELLNNCWRLNDTECQPHKTCAQAFLPFPCGASFLPGRATIPILGREPGNFNRAGTQG